MGAVLGNIGCLAASLASPVAPSSAVTIKYVSRHLPDVLCDAKSPQKRREGEINAIVQGGVLRGEGRASAKAPKGWK